MKVLRLAWSGYQEENSLAREAEAFERLGVDYHRPEQAGETSAHLREFRTIIINSKFTVDEDFLAELQPGSLIITASSGYDHIDLEACSDHRINVARTPLARARRVAEHTEMFARALLRSLPGSCYSLRRGNWKRNQTADRVRSPGEERAGIIGYGVIGRKSAQRFLDIFSAPLLVSDPLHQKKIEQHPRLKYCELQEIVEEATLLTIHADLNDSTHGLFTERVFQKMPADALLINTARGEMIRLPDLARALEKNEISGAALDVFPQEPPGEDSKYLDKENLLVTPHSAGFGPGLLEELREELICTVDNFMAGESLPYKAEPYSKKQSQKLNLQVEKLQK